MSQRLFITGAGIAGNTAAWCLGRAGFDVTVVEKAPAFRDGGQDVDVRGAGREVLRRMALEEVAKEQGTGEEGTALVEAGGKVAASFLKSDADSEGQTAEMEILRSDLAHLLYGPAEAHATYRFDDRIAAIEQHHAEVTVSFARGKVERFNGVIVAEGVGPATHELVSPGENDPCWMVSRSLSSPYRTPATTTVWGAGTMRSKSRSISLCPDRHSTTHAKLSVKGPTHGEEDWDAERQKSWLHERFADAGWHAPRVLTGMATTDDFCFDVLRQVRMPHWSSSRIVLTGDATWCATPIAGLGTTLAVTGACLLAAALTRADDIVAAFAAYETAKRPMVQDVQAVPKIAPRLMDLHSRAAIRILHGVLNVASQPVIRRITSKLFRASSKEPDLTIYDAPPSLDAMERGPLPGPESNQQAHAGSLSPLAAAGLIAIVLGTIAIIGQRNAPDPSHPEICRWYARLNKPEYTQPDAVFALVWPALKAGLAVGGYRLLRRPAGSARNAAAGLWLLNTAMIGGWSEIFFRKRRLDVSAANAGAVETALRLIGRMKLLVRLIASAAGCFHPVEAGGHGWEVQYS